MVEEGEITKRFVSKGAEEELGKEYPILDHGFVMLVDYMGNDTSIAQAARTSYGKGTKTSAENRTLLRYLVRRRHTTPLEMAVLKFYAKMPIFVARQWVRHRMASINEYSGRYSIMHDEFFIPAEERIQFQSKANNQGSSDEEVPPELKQRVLDLLIQDAGQSFEHYAEITKAGIAKELARIGLPLSTYTEWFWKADLHNLFNFLKLRTASDAQEEIRQYAIKIGEITKNAFPLTYEAFEDYVLNAITLSSLEQKVIKEIINGTLLFDAAEKYLETNWEINEFLEKWNKLKNETP